MNKRGKKKFKGERKFQEIAKLMFGQVEEGKERLIVMRLVNVRVN